MSKREFKFRAWDGQDMYYIKDGNSLTVWNEPSRVDWNVYNSDCRVVSSQYPDTALMQFTGLFDKKGNEIYEGDILEQEGIVEAVIFFDGGFGFDMNTRSGFSRLVQDRTKNFTIIGNIFTNHNLIKAETKCI